MIVICSYTANLTTYLTVSRIGDHVSKYEQVAACPEVSTTRFYLHNMFTFTPQLQIEMFSKLLNLENKTNRKL